MSLGNRHLLSMAAPYTSLLVAALVSIFLLNMFVPPYPAIALLWLAACVVNAGLARRVWVKLVWVNAAAAFLLFGLVDSYLFFFERSQLPYSVEGTKGWIRPDKVLGHAPKSGAFVIERVSRGDVLMWDVTYTIDDHGLRVTPHELAGC
jgi:hypothetical protein